MSDLMQQTAFDYEVLDERTREFVLQKTCETHGLIKRTAQHIINIGQNLLEVKAHLPHGSFGPWLQVEFAMSDRHARRLMEVAEKFGMKMDILSDFPVSVLYELASSSNTVIEMIETRRIPSTVDAIKEARKAERQIKEVEQQAYAEMQSLQRHLFDKQEEANSQQAQIEQLTRTIEMLQERIALLSPPVVQIKEVEKPVVPLEVTTQLETFRQQVDQLTRQRDMLAKQVNQLGEEARAATFKRDEGEYERRVRLNWYRVTNEFQASIRTILSQWPSPLDVQAFEADDWNRLTQTKELARRFLEECHALTGGSGSMIVDSAMLSHE